MIIRNLTPTGDWTFGLGTGNYLNGNPAIDLNIKTRLYSWLNDCFFDMNAGIDWYNRLGSKNQRTLLENDLRRMILQSYGVTGIVTFSTSLTGRAFTANFTINTIFSQGFVSSVTMLPPAAVLAWDQPGINWDTPGLVWQ